MFIIHVHMNMYTKRIPTLLLSSLEHAICTGVRPLSFESKALSLMLGSAPDFKSSFVISTPVSSGKATAI